MTERQWVLGVDIGGTSVTVGAVSVDGREVLGLRNAPTPVADGPDAVVEGVAEMASGAFAELKASGGDGKRVLGVGIGCPGPLRRDEGVVVTTPNLGWKDFPIRDRVSDALGLPAALDNDANCAVLGEWWQGAGRGSRILVGLTLGTGIGGGIVLDGRVFHGASDVAGEAGHMTVNFSGRRCKCGNYGCLEAYASGPNIASRAVEGLRSGTESSLQRFLDDGPERITAEVIAREAVAGDAFATHIMTETAELLGAGVASLVNLLNPDTVVIAGGVARAGPPLFTPLRGEVRRRAFQSGVDACSIVPGALPDRAGVVGAAATFLLDSSGRLPTTDAG